MIAINVTPRHIVWVVALSSLAACGRVPGQFEIVNNQVPLSGCAIPTNDNVYQGQGLLDISLVRSTAQSAYFFFPLIRNNLEPPGGTIDTNQIFLSSFAVDISLLGRAQPQTQQVFDGLEGDSTLRALLHYKTPWSGSVRSGGGEISAYVPAFPPELAARIQATQEISSSPSLAVNLRVRAFGSTTTAKLESDPFDFPLYVCSGCLIANLQPCPYTTPAVNQGNDCNVAQDAPVDCCLSGNDLICPPLVVTP
jgi:hypothetical protein